MTLITLLETSPAAFAGVAAVFGLAIGSFLNVVVHRLPTMLMHRWRQECRELMELDAAEAQTAQGTTRHRGSATGTPHERQAYNLIVPGSHCPHCGHRIRALENIPVVSYLWLKGRCAACGKAIGARYPLVETLCAGLSAVTAWHFGFGAAAFGALALTWALIALTFIDVDRQLLPDIIVLPFLWLGLLLNTFGVFTSLTSAVIGAAAGYLSLWLVFQLFRLATGKEGMGYGDFKLFALLGAWAGWQVLPLLILLASLIGAIVGVAVIVLKNHGRSEPIPFGPFLCGAGWIALLWGQQLTTYYLQVARLSG